MRTAHELLETLDTQHVTIAVDEDKGDWRASKLRISGKAAQLTQELRRDIKRFALSIVAVLIACQCKECASRYQTQPLAFPVAIDYNDNDNNVGNYREKYG
jgi:hypothetical protein